MRDPHFLGDVRSPFRGWIDDVNCNISSGNPKGQGEDQRDHPGGFNGRNHPQGKGQESQVGQRPQHRGQARVTL